MELQCNSFKITNYRKLQTTKISFTDIFGRNEFSCNQDLSNSFYLTLLHSLPLSGKTNGVQTNIGHENTEHAWTTNLACIFLYHFLFIWIIAIIQKQIIIKIFIWWRESCKISTQIWKDSHGLVLVSPSVSHTHSSTSNFKAWKVKQNNKNAT